MNSSLTANSWKNQRMLKLVLVAKDKNKKEPNITSCNKEGSY